ncbi:hypothetical protein D6789_01805 [Candidatus Woesearchaeota archaeon]|nr:MAG: hypothetical protein D6789_01805 [Candidatus Woesearchaeota archaeon]
MSRHLKRLTAPRTWPIAPKTTKFVTRPQPGAHAFRNGVPMSILLRDMLGLARTTREVKYILRTQEVLVNGRRVRRPDVLVGLMDVVTFPSTKTSYRILINELEKLYALPITGKEATCTPSKVISKRLLPGGKMQLGFHNSRTLIVEKEAEKVHVGDTMLFTAQGVNHLPLEKGAAVLLTAGSHVGKCGSLKSLSTNIAEVTVGNECITTTKHNLFVIGKGKPEIKL